MQKKALTISLYLEFLHLGGGFLYKKVGTGLLSSYKNQKKMLERAGIAYFEKYDPDCDILQINTPWLYSLFVIRRAKRSKKKVIIWAHVTAEDIRGVFRFSYLIAPLAKRYLTYAYNLADLVFAPSEYTKKLLIGYGIPAEKIVALSNGVDMDKYAFDLARRERTRTQLGIAPDRLIVGAVALAVPRKGIDTFIMLAKRFPDYTFVWFGKIYSSLIAPSIPKPLPPNVIFTGYVDDIIGAYGAIDIFLFPSYEENEGMAILEAASAKRPLVVRDIPVYEGWLEHDQNCLKADSDAAFITMIERLDPSQRTRLGAAAYDLARSRSLDVIQEKTLALYTNLLGK